MNVPFFAPAREYKKYKGDINKTLKRVLENGQLCLGFGPDIEEFETSFANYVGSKHAIMCGAGTQALYLAYKVLGIGQGDEVITTSHTFMATIDQIVALGAKPVLVDIGDDGLIDIVKIREAITPQTKAIVPVHLEGKVCDMVEIMNIAKEHNLLVIEDAAQAIGAKRNEQFAGTFGNVGCFSMYPAKVLGSLGNAGMVVTNDDELAKRLKMLRCNYNIGKNQDTSFVEYGTNMEPDNVQAAVLNVKLKRLNDLLSKRKKIAEKYDDAFKGLPITLPTKQDGRIYQDYVIRLKDRKEEFVNYLKEKGIGILGHNLIPNHKYPSLNLNFELPRTDEYISEQVRIPCSPHLKNNEVAYIIKSIKDFYEILPTVHNE